MADSFLSGPSGRYGRSAIHRFRRLSRVCIMCTRRTGTRISCPFSIPPNRILGLERFIRLTLFPATTGLPMLFFFFQAEDGIRGDLVTGVQTCALPISAKPFVPDVGAGRPIRGEVPLPE